MLETHINLEPLIAKIDKLSPMGQTVQKALALINDPSCDADRLAGVLSLDEAMTGMILKLANSAYFATTHKVSSVKHAVTYLGQQNVKSLLLSASVAFLMNRPLPGYGLNRGELWTHAIGMAAGARWLIVRLDPALADAAYAAGMLADLGMLALDSLLQEEAIPNLNARTAATVALEHQYLGVDHAGLGAEVARRWNLPEPLVDAIAHHHDPMQATSGHILAAALHLANAVLINNGIGAGHDTSGYLVDERVFHFLKVSTADYDTLYAAIKPLIQSAKASVA
jgi:HD-like signal output (HDOD) protein